MYWWNSDTIILWMWSSPFSVKMVMTNRVIFTSHRGSRGTNKVACFRSSVALHKLNSSSPYVHSLCCSLERVGASAEVSWAKQAASKTEYARAGGRRGGHHNTSAFTFYLCRPTDTPTQPHSLSAGSVLLWLSQVCSASAALLCCGCLAQPYCNSCMLSMLQLSCWE